MDLMDYRRKIIANSPHLKSASGAVATFPDGADGLPLKSLIVNIDPVQSGTGDPSPSNVRPITGWNGVKVTRIGKNLFNPHVYTGIAYNPTVGNTVTLTDSAVQFTDNGNGVFTITTSATWRYFNVIIPIDPTKEYVTKIAFSSTGQAGVTRGYLDADFKILTKFNSTDTAISWEYSLIPETDAAYYYFVFTNRGTKSATLTLTQPQFVEGTTVGAYEPYNGVNVSIDLGQTVYGGTLNPLTGVLTVDRYLWELSTESSQWNKSSSYSGGFYTGGANYVWNWQQVKPNTPFICSHAKTATTLSEYRANRNVCYMDNSINIRIMSDTATKQDWIDYLTAQKSAGTPVQVCCYLKNPVTIQLTPQQIRSLYGNNTIYADTGNVALEYWAHA